MEGNGFHPVPLCPLHVVSVLAVSSQEFRTDPVLGFSLCWWCIIAGRSLLLPWLLSSPFSVVEVPSPEQSRGSDRTACILVTHHMLLLFKWTWPIYFWDPQLHCKFLFSPFLLHNIPWYWMCSGLLFCYPSLFFSRMNLILLFYPYS